jgi:chlorite dismutase
MSSDKDPNSATRGSLRLAPAHAEVEIEKAKLPRQFVNFTFYHARPDWRLLADADKQRCRDEFVEDRLHIIPGKSQYLFVYPFVKTREWYSRPADQRQEMMDEHIRIGMKYRSVKLHTTYSFGLDDQEFVVAFETDYPSDFLDLVQELRETKASSYTLRDTPMFTCRQRTLSECLEALG